MTAMPVDSQIRTIVGALAASDFKPVSQQTPLEARRQYARMIRARGIEPEPVGLSESGQLIDGSVWPYDTPMATVTVKSTFSLDVESARLLDSLARRWNTSKSAALRRAIRSAAEQARSGGNEALDSLDRLQNLLALNRRTAADWEDQVTQERRARTVPT